MSAASNATKHHVRQLLMGVYQAHLQEDKSPSEAREAVGKFLQEALSEWQAAEKLTTPALSPMPVLRRALEECRRLGPQGAGIMRALVDLQNMLGGK